MSCKEILRLLKRIQNEQQERHEKIISLFDTILENYEKPKNEVKSCEIAIEPVDHEKNEEPSTVSTIEKIQLEWNDVIRCELQFDCQSVDRRRIKINVTQVWLTKGFKLMWTCYDWVYEEKAINRSEKWEKCHLDLKNCKMKTSDRHMSSYGLIMST